MDAIACLQTRNSASKLQDPAPDSQALTTILQAAMRAPDHGRLRPWRFMSINGVSRDRLGKLYQEALLIRDPNASDSECAKVLAQPLRAPLIMVVIARFIEHEKVPRDEQLLSAGAAAHSILLAAHALGYAGIWRTGVNTEDNTVRKGLGINDNEVIVGFLYLGTLVGSHKVLPQMNVEDFLTQW